MTSSDHRTLTFIHCGRSRLLATQLDEHSSKTDIDEQARHLFGSGLPWYFCLQFYHCAKKTFVTLDEQQLRGEFNPFRIATQYSEDLVNFVELYIVDVTEAAESNHTHAGISCREPSPIDFDSMLPTTATESPGQQDLSVVHNATENNSGADEDSLDALISRPIDMSSSELSSPDPKNFDESTESSEARNNETDFPSSNRSSSGYEVNTVTLTGALLREPLPVDHSSTSNNLQAPVLMGDSLPPWNDLPNRIAAINAPQSSTELAEPSNERWTRLRFSLDVKPTQKPIYLSDEINQRNTQAKNGFITRVQGFKANQSDRSTVFPKLHFSRNLLSKSAIRLLVYVVSERLENGIRLWFQHRDKGFLPPNYGPETSLINPQQFDRNQIHLTPQSDPSQIYLTLEDDLILKLRMITRWNKLQEEKKIYELDDESTKRLHPAEHDPLSPRLLCLLAEGWRLRWDTMCLSDFIRDPKNSKRTSDSILAPVNTTMNKRSRTQ